MTQNFFQNFVFQNYHQRELSRSSVINYFISFFFLHFRPKFPTQSIIFWMAHSGVIFSLILKPAKHLELFLDIIILSVFTLTI